jgi:transcriptional regulator with XRE-family HTH domain
VPIGVNILKFSKQKNMSLYRLAKDSKISESYLNDIVHGRANNPSVKLLKSIADVLGVSIQKLIE